MLGASETLMTDLTEAGSYAFEVTAADGCAQVAAVVELLPKEVVDINTVTIDLLCEGVAPGTCPPIALDFETPDADNISKYLARITVVATGEVFERMIQAPPLTVRPFLPPRIVGEEVDIEIAVIFDDNSVGVFSEARTFVVDCEDTVPLTFIEDRSVEQNLQTLEVLVQPNPASETFDLTIIGAETSAVQITIRDLNGKAILSTQFPMSSPQHTQRIAVGHLPTGVYFVSAKTQEGVLVKQLVKL